MEEKEHILRRKDRGVLMQVEEQKQNKGRRWFRAGLELRVAKYLVLRVFTTVYCWFFTTPLTTFLSPSNLQTKRIKILWDQWLSECISCVGLAMSTVRMETKFNVSVGLLELVSQRRAKFHNSTVTAAMKLKDACSLEGRLWKPRQGIKKQRHQFATKVCQSKLWFFL